MEPTEEPLRHDGRDLRLEDVSRVARNGPRASLAPAAREAIALVPELVARLVAEGRRTYGINTGFGALSTETIPTADLARNKALLCGNCAPSAR